MKGFQVGLDFKNAVDDDSSNQPDKCIGVRNCTVTVDVEFDVVCVMKNKTRTYMKCKEEREREREILRRDVI